MADHKNLAEDINGFDDPKRNFAIPKWSIAFAVILAVLIGIALALPQFLDQSRYKDQIIQKVADATGYTVNWDGNVDLSILPLPHVTVRNATLSAGAQKIITLKEAEVAVALKPLFHKQIEIKSVRLIEPDISLIVDATGRQTWMTEKLASNDSSDNGEKKPDSSNKQSVSIEALHIEKGNLLYRDEQKKSEHVITNLNADISAESLQGPFALDAALTYNGTDIEAKGNVGALAEGQDTQVALTIKLPQLNASSKFNGNVTTGDALKVKGGMTIAADDLQKSIRAFTKKETELPPELQGKLDASTNIDYTGDALAVNDILMTLGDVTYKGAVTAQNLKAAPLVAMNMTSTGKGDARSLIGQILKDFKINGTGSYANNTLTLQPTTISFDGQTAELQGSYKTPPKNARPIVNLTLSANELDIDDLQQQLNKKASTGIEKSSDKKAGNEKTNGVELPFDGQIKGQIGKLSFSGKSYSNLKFDLASAGPNLKINEFFISEIADSSASVRGQISNLPQLSGLDLTLAAKTGNIEGLMQAYGVQPPDIGHTLGAASLNGRFSGSLDKLSFDATASALQFAIKGVGSVATPLAQPVIETLNLNVKHPSLQNAVRIVSPGFEASGSLNGPLDISSTISWDKNKYHLADIRGNLGSTTAGGDLNIVIGEKKPSVTGNLNFGKLVFESATPDAGGGSGDTGGSASAKDNNRWSREAINTDWMKAANADLGIKVASLQSGLWLLNNANLAFKLNDGTLTVDDLSAGMFGGTVKIDGKMKSGEASRAPLSMNWSAKAANINGQNLLSAIRGKNSDTLTGTIQSFNMDIAANGISPAALVYGLSGKGDAKANNLVIKGIDAAKLAQAAAGSFKPLERAGTLFGAFQDGQTSFTDFDMVFGITNGIVNFTTLKFDGPQALLNSTGNVNLPRWTVDLKNTMTVKNTDIPPFVFTVSGPLDNPLQTGSSVIENYLKQRAQAKIEKELNKQIGKQLDKLGLPGLLGGAANKTPVKEEVTEGAAPATDAANETPAETSSEPAPATETSAEPAPKTKQEKKAEQIQQGVKALQGIFGQ